MRENEPLHPHGSVQKCRAAVKETKYLRHTRPKKIKVAGFQTQLA